MTKFFRDNSRIFLLVFMSLLLVIFLIQDSVGRGQRQQMEAVQNAEVGTAFGKSVRLREVNQAGTDLQIARELGFNIRLPAGDQFDTNVSAYLLMEEAARMGVRVSRAELHSQLDQMEGSGRAIDALCRRYECAPEAIDAALMRVLSINQLMGIMLETAALESTPRVEHRYRKQNQEADVLVSQLDARSFASKATEPTEDEIKAHFEEAKNRPNEHKDEELVFGYRIPDRVKVEYITIDPKELLPHVSVRERELKNYFDQNKNKYTKPAIGPSPDPASPAQNIPMSFDEAKERVKEDYRTAKAAQEAQSIINRIRDEAYAPWNAMPPNSEGIRPAPATQANLSFADLAAKYAKDPSRPIRITHKVTELIDQNALQNERGFASARVTERNRQINAVSLAFHAVGLPKQAMVGDRAQLRILEPSPVMSATQPGAMPGTSAQPYMFRVVDVALAGPPATLDEAREKIVKNLKLKKAHEMAGQYAQAIGERAKEIGIAAAVLEAVEAKQIIATADAAIAAQPLDPANPGKYTVKLDPVAPTSCTAERFYGPNIQSAPAIGAKAIAATTQPVNPPQKYHVVVSPFTKTGDAVWMIVQVNGLKPIYADEFKAQKDMLEQRAMTMSGMSFVSSWMSRDAIHKRTGFVPKAGNATAQ